MKIVISHLEWSAGETFSRHFAPKKVSFKRFSWGMIMHRKQQVFPSNAANLTVIGNGNSRSFL
jgi:hypothetical protein